MLSAEVAVVGAGPAGAAAAITLARAGRHVVLIDKARFPRDKCCGDGLTTGALRRLDALGLDPADVASWHTVNDAWVTMPSGGTTHFPLPRSGGQFAAVAQRVDLDAALLDVARRVGVEVHDGHGVSAARLEASGRAVRLEVKDLEAVVARYVIAADGMWSPLRKMMQAPDAPGYLGEWHAFRQYFRNTELAQLGMWVLFEKDLLPGYAWAFPLPDGRANLGFGLLRTGGSKPTGAMGRTWAQLLARPHIRALVGEQGEPEEPPRAWPIPGRIGRSPLSAGNGRVLFAGDAARAADPMTGEGIAQALETGELAARAVLAAGPHDAAAAAWRYESIVRTGLAVDHRLAEYFSRVLARPTAADKSAKLVGWAEWTRRNFARWMFEDYPRAVLATPHRWRRGMLHGRGAFINRAPAG